MYKLLKSLPPPEKVKIDNGITDKGYYKVHTFTTHMEEQVNKTIEYYYNKYDMFLEINQRAFMKQYTNFQSVPSIEKMLDTVYKNYSQQVLPSWQALQAIATKDLSSEIQKLNNHTHQLIQAGETNIKFAEVLNILGGNQAKNSSFLKQIPGVIDISSIQNYLSSLASGTLSGKQLSGTRSTLFGEIFEQVANSYLAYNLDNIMNVFQTGKNVALLPKNPLSGTQSIGSGKSDGIIISNQLKLDFKASQKKVPSYFQLRSTQANIELEGSELFDLSKSGYKTAIEKYVNNSVYGNILGISSKAWIKPGSMGNFSISASEINKRVGGISDFFSKQNEFRAYTAYTISKYLINVIGVYNALVASGANGIMPTYQWLAQIYNNNYMLEHSIRLKNSTKPSKYKNSKGYKHGGNFDANNSVFIGKQKLSK